MDRDVGCCGLATGKSSCHFITKVSGAIARKQDLLKKCIQGRGVPFLRKGTTSGHPEGLGRGGWQAGGGGTGLAPRHLFTAGVCDPLKVLAVGELC